MQDRTAAIAGAGIIGLATALELANAGWHVTVFDQREAMSEASRAAAGMLAGLDSGNASRASPPRPPQPLHLSRLPRPREALSARTHPAPHPPHGPGRIPSSGDARCSLSTRFARWPLGSSPAACSFSSSKKRASTPGISPRLSLPPCALPASISTSIHRSSASARRLRRRILKRRRVLFPPALPQCRRRLVSALDASLPVFPRKGHMLTAELPGVLQTQCVLRTPEVYIVPRGANRYTIGSTVEDAGFDRTVDPLQHPCALPERHPSVAAAAQSRHRGKLGGLAPRLRATICPSSTPPLKTAGSPPATSETAFCSPRPPPASCPMDRRPRSRDRPHSLPPRPLRPASLSS